MTLENLLDAARANASDVSALEALASFALTHQQEHRALGVLEDGVKRHKNSALLWQWLALLQRATDDRVSAVDAFAKAAVLAPNDATIAKGRAQTLLEAGLPAVDAFATARKLTPNDGDIVLGVTAALFAEGQAETALSILAGSVSANPLWLYGHRDLVQLRWMMGEGSASFASLRQATATNPESETLWAQLIHALMQAGLNEEALAAIADGRKAIGESPRFVINEAVIRSDAGDRAAAARLFGGFEDGDDPTVAVRIIRHHLRYGDLTAATRLIDLWIGRPGEALVWPYASLCWRLLGDARADWLEGEAALVRVFDLAAKLPPLDRLAELLRGLHVARSQHLDQSVRGGTQTDGALFARIEPEIRQLRAAIAGAVAEYVAGLPPRDAAHPTLGPQRDPPVRFAGSWSVRLAGNGFHANHVHPAGWISSALYVALPERGPADGANAGWLALRAPEAGLGLDLPPEQLIEPKPGRLVMFPSTMWHGTLPFEAGERLTVAFDVAPPMASASAEIT